MWAATTDEHTGLIPYVHWVQYPERDVDLSVWDPSSAARTAWDQVNIPMPPPQRKSTCNLDARKGSSGRNCPESCSTDEPKRACRACKCRSCTQCMPPASSPPQPPPALPSLPWEAKQSVAIFRGSVHRLNVYSQDWRRVGPRRVQITADNWASVGRTALLPAKERRPELLNARLGSGSLLGHSDRIELRLGIPNRTWEAQDKGSFMPFSEQLSYKYSVNVEGHGGWADRLYKLMLHEQLALLQDLPAKLWYEAALRPWEHFVPVAADLSDLPEKIEWARSHDEQAQRMAAAAREVTTRWLTPAAMFRYTEEMLLGYAELVKHVPTPSPRAIAFQCRRRPGLRLPGNGSAPESCWVERGRKMVRVDRVEERCFFSLDGCEFGSLYEASLALDAKGGKDAAKPEHSPGVVEAAAEVEREALDQGALRRAPEKAWWMTWNSTHPARLRFSTYEAP